MSDQPLLPEKGDSGKSTPDGHIGHWSEFFFGFGALVGIGLVPATLMLTIPYAPLIVGGVGGLSSLLGLSLTWNLATTKRIAMATEQLKADVGRLEAENDRAREMQDTVKQQDAMMKEKLNEMKQASLLLSASANSLEKIQEQEEGMIKERLEMLEERRELSNKMQVDMRRTLDLSLEAAKEELAERGMLFFKAASADGAGLEVGSPEWLNMRNLLELNNIEINADAAGEDGVMDLEEFIVFLDEVLEAHFKKLKVAVLEVHDMEMSLIEAEIDAI